MTRDWKIGLCGVCALALALLAFALFGRPPYFIFSMLRWTVATATGLGAWALYRDSKRYLQASLWLALVGGIHLFGRMRRSQWVVFDWMAALTLFALLVILLVSLRGSRSGVGRGVARTRP